MNFKLPELEYKTDFLEPVIDKETVEIHHGKHHATYVNNLNNICKEANLEFTNEDLVNLIANVNELDSSIKQGIINHGGGHLNHMIFWNCITNPNNSKLEGKIQEKITEDFGSYDNFKAEFTKKALGQFGSGWAFLVLNKSKKLEIVSTSNQENPVTKGLVPLLTVDVWEHAYYLKYQNRRAEFVENFFKIINWEYVNKILSENM